MTNFLLEQYKANKSLRYVVIFFALLSVWWFYMYMSRLEEGPHNTAFLLVYPTISLIGGIYGMMFARKWGGFRSAFGVAVSMFSLGLLAQFVGQHMYNYYQIYLGIDTPYPSIGDLVYFMSVILYIVGAFYLAKVSGFKFTLHTVQGKFKAIAIPLVILAVSYMVLLQGYEADWSSTLIVLLDFVWPIGQAVYLSIAILALLISKDILGGLMRKPIMFLIVALVAQFLADFIFSYQVSREINAYYPGGTNDYMYAVSYFLMTIALFSIGNMFYKVQDT